MLPDVAGFGVAMDDAFLVRLAQPIVDLHGVIKDVGDAHALARDHVAEACRPCGSNPEILHANWLPPSQAAAALSKIEPPGSCRSDMIKKIHAMLQDKKIASLQADIQAESNPIKRLILGREVAQQYIGEGVSGAAIAGIEQLLSEYGPSIPTADVETLKADLALAYFRLGELENCTWNHNADVCLFPIQGEGVHKAQLGASEAAKRYAALLDDPATNP